MKVSVLDLQRRHWPILSYLPHSLLRNVRLVYVLGFTGTCVLLATKDDTLLSFGNSRSLTPEICSDLSTIGEVEEFAKKRIRGFACNSRLCVDNDRLFVVVFLDKDVYSWGCDPSTEDFLHVPVLIDKMQDTVVKVACGKSHCLILTSGGKVYAWGDNTYRQADYAFELDSVRKPVRLFKRLNKSDEVTDIACGSNFSVAVTRQHKVFGWGKNVDGCLGKNTDEQYVVRKISFFNDINVQQIACGENHILALDHFGALFSSGDNTFGQLGYDAHHRTDITGVSNVSERFKEIAAAINASVGVTFSGDVLVWGQIADGRIESPLKTPCRSINEAFALYRLGGMHKEFELISGNENVAETVRNSFGNPDTSDFKIVVQGKEIFVHKSILAMRSKYFERMFEKNWKEGKESFIKMDESYEGMSAFLKYLYTDEINTVDLNVLLDVAIIADKYCESYLVNLCKEKFECGLNDLNVAELYQSTLDRQLSNFSELCINYASRHLKAVITSDGCHSWKAETFKTFFQQDKIKSVLD